MRKHLKRYKILILAIILCSCRNNIKTVIMSKKIIKPHVVEEIRYIGFQPMNEYTVKVKVDKGYHLFIKNRHFGEWLEVDSSVFYAKNVGDSFIVSSL